MSTSITKRVKRTFTDQEKHDIISNIENSIAAGSKITKAIADAGISAPLYYNWLKLKNKVKTEVVNENKKEVKDSAEVEMHSVSVEDEDEDTVYSDGYKNVTLDDLLKDED